MQVFMEMFERSGTPSQSVNLELGDPVSSKQPSKDVLHHRLGCFTFLGLCGHSPLSLHWLESNLHNAQTLQRRLLVLVLFFVEVTGRNFGQVAFCNNPITGFFLLLGVLVASPTVAAAGLLASTVSLVFALATNHPRESITSGCTGFNAVLFGLVMKSIVLGGDEDGTDDATAWIIIIVGSAATVALANGIGSALGSLSPPVPSLSLPFNLVAVVATLMLTFRNEQPGVGPESSGGDETQPVDLLEHLNNSVHHSEDLGASEEIDYALLLQGSLLGVSQVIAVNDLACSAVVLGSMLICSPLLMMSGFLGSLLTTCLAALLSPSLLEYAYNGLMGYNGFLTAAAVVFFFVPGRRSALLALLAVVVTLAAQVALSWAFSDISLPIFSLPFVGVSMAVLGARGPPRPPTLTFPEHHYAQWREARKSLSAPLASLSLPSLSQQSLRSSTVTENRWRRTPSL